MGLIRLRRSLLFHMSWLKLLVTVISTYVLLNMVITFNHIKPIQIWKVSKELIQRQDILKWQRHNDYGIFWGNNNKAKQNSNEESHKNINMKPPHSISQEEDNDGAYIDLQPLPNDDNLTKSLMGNKSLQSRSENLFTLQKLLSDHEPSFINNSNHSKSHKLLANNSYHSKSHKLHVLGKEIVLNSQESIMEQVNNAIAKELFSNSPKHTVKHRVQISTENFKGLHQKPLIIGTEIGRLGNQLFQYVSSYVIAQQTNHQTAINNNSLLLHVFKNLKTVKINIKSYKYRDIPKVEEEKAGMYSTNISLKVPHNESVQLCCYFQSWKYFKQYEKDIRQQLQFKDNIIEKTNAYLHNIMSGHLNNILRNNTLLYHKAYNNVSLLKTAKDFTYVGVHVRLTDMNSKLIRRRGYTSAPLRYIVRAIQYYRKRYLNTVFLVLSDNIYWCQKYIPTTNNDIVFIHGNPKYDFATLASCNHSIITVGTFGWWAAWLAGGSVVYYSGFPVPGTEIGNLYKKQDYYPPHWIPME